MRSLKYTHSFEVVRELLEPLQPLRDLAYNLWWTWNQPARDLFQETDPDLWESTGHNPVQMLNRIPISRQQRLIGDDVYMAKIALCTRELAEYMAGDTWFDRTYPGKREGMRVAYFCAEFGLHESLPIYSGGLGVLAGDHLKAASDLGIPLVGVGLLYARGYFRQFLNPDGWQQERYPQLDFYQLPIRLVRNNHEPLRVVVEMPDREVTCQVWKAQVGRVELYLLDSNILENAPRDQSITDTLYGGDQEMRIRQEMVLGIGGYRALEELGLVPSVCHMNEGHAAFLSLERIRHFMDEKDCELRVARQCVVAGNVFTTHTPVPAGFDKFEYPLLERYLSKSVGQLGMPFDYFARMGRIREDDWNEPFNMAVLAMSNSNAVNGVSELHAKVTREMFSDRWPKYSVEEVPVFAVTNGVHLSSWISGRMAGMLDRYLGKEWRDDPANPDHWARVAEIPDHELWELLENNRGDLVRWCRKKLRQMMRRNNAAQWDIASVSEVLDPRVLTIGFARRFATYKRAGLLLTDRERLKRLLFNAERPVQFVFAGKSHPKDDGGKKLIQEIVHFIRNEGARSRMVFIEDYDMDIARNLVQGVDIWLNNPRRPMEASGTSGMKVVANGGLNCSVLDGWWDEGYDPEVGWAIGEEHTYDDWGYQDWLDARSLYHILENEIAPRFYNRSDGGVPAAWLEMVRASMQRLAPRFTTHRMVQEYTRKAYVPANDGFSRLSREGLGRAKAALDWRERVLKSWAKVGVVDVRDDASVETPIGGSFAVTVHAELGDLAPEDVKVQALVGQVGANRELHEIKTQDLELKHTGKPCVFEGQIACDSPGHRGYVVRIVPFHPDVNVPNELALVAWEDSPIIESP